MTAPKSELIDHNLKPNIKIRSALEKPGNNTAMNLKAPVMGFFLC